MAKKKLINKSVRQKLQYKRQEKNIKKTVEAM